MEGKNDAVMQEVSEQQPRDGSVSWSYLQYWRDEAGKARTLLRKAVFLLDRAHKHQKDPVTWYTERDKLKEVFDAEYRGRETL